MKKFAITFLILLIACMAGCSAGGTPVTAPTAPPVKIAGSDQQLMSAFDATWDGVSDTMTLVADREVMAHYNVTGYVSPDYISMQIISWDAGAKILTVEVTVQNPTVLNPYDMRFILINMGAKKLINADDYTKLFDPNNPQQINPFRTFAKQTTNRVFASQAIHSENLELYFPDTWIAAFRVSASWPGNSPEPYDIVDLGQSGTLYETSGSLDISAEVLDWQDTTADEVILQSNPITGAAVSLTLVDATNWEATITNTAGAPPGDYEVWVEAHDAVSPHILYNKITLTVNPDGTAEWENPVLISGATPDAEILAKLLHVDGDYWVIYSNGTDIFARNSTDRGATWSAATTIASYAGVDTIQALRGGDGHIYVQYQKSASDNTYVSKFDGVSWSSPVMLNDHALSLPPYSCDLGISETGTVYSMYAGDWSTLGYETVSPYDLSDWDASYVQTFYNGIYSMNGGFVQRAAIPKFFFVHDDTSISYAWNDGGWDKMVVRTGAEELIEPGIAPESDGPFHGVLGIDDTGSFSIEYFRFNDDPPGVEDTVLLASGLIDKPIWHTVSAEGTDISVVYEADGEIRYIDSSNDGDTFGDVDVLAGGGGGGASYCDILRDPFTDDVAVVYSELNGNGDYDLFFIKRTDVP